jgi:hypothetical protein
MVAIVVVDVTAIAVVSCVVVVVVVVLSLHQEPDSNVTRARAKQARNELWLGGLGMVWYSNRTCVSVKLKLM